MISDKNENQSSAPRAYRQGYSRRNSQGGVPSTRRWNEPLPTSPDLRSAQDELRERQLAGLRVLLSLSTPLAADVARTGPLYVPAKPRVPPTRAGLPALLRDRALRGAVSLMLSAGLTGILSFVFWTYAAHHQNASAVGIITGEVSSITFLASLSSLNLISIFGRFLPIAGWSARRLILRSYGAACLAGLITSAIFLMTPFSKDLVIGGQLGCLGFVVCVVLNSVFNIQDGGLIGFGRFGWVPIENVSVALVRIILLPVIAIFMSAGADLVWSWALPMIIAVVVVNTFVIGPLAGRKKGERPNLPSFGKIGRLVAVGSASSAISGVASSFLPALVTNRLGSGEGAYFYVPWTIATMTLLLMTNITISMVREVVANPNRAGAVIRRSVGLAGIMVFVILVFCSLFGRLLLAPMGANFVTYGAPLLRWIGFAMPATAIIALWWSVCSIRQRPLPGLLVAIMVSGGILGGVALLKSGAGIDQVGFIYCVVEWSTAALISLPTFSALRTIAHEGKRDNHMASLPA